MRFSDWLVSGLAAVALAFGVPRLAHADGNETPETQDDGSDEDSAGGSTNHADRSTLTLPSHASDTALANAFGQQGDRMRAAHETARQAAAGQARQAAAAMAAALASGAASGHASATRGPNSHAASGLAHADSARGAHAPSTVPPLPATGSAGTGHGPPDSHPSGRP